LYGFILSPDRSSCSPAASAKYNIFEGCDVLQYNAKLSCTACAPGHYFSNGACVQCPLSVLDNGCSVCDYNQPDKCLVCQDDHYQDKQGSCLPINVEIIQDSAPIARAMAFTLAALIVAVWIN